MPAFQASTSRRFLFAAPLVVLGGWAVNAGADPDYRGALGGELAQLTAKGPTAVKPPEKTIKMQKRGEPWPATLNWLATETGMGVSASVPLPTENFTYYAAPGKDSYTIPEVVDILNEQLMGQTKPCVLI